MPQVLSMYMQTALGLFSAGYVVWYSCSWLYIVLGRILVVVYLFSSGMQPNSASGNTSAPSGGNPAPSGGNPTPSGGNPAPSGGNPTPSGGNPAPSGGITPELFQQALVQAGEGRGVVPPAIQQQMFSSQLQQAENLYQSQLEQLQMMGFPNRQANLNGMWCDLSCDSYLHSPTYPPSLLNHSLSLPSSALVETGGDVNAAVNRLLQWDGEGSLRLMCNHYEAINIKLTTTKIKFCFHVVHEVWIANLLLLISFVAEGVKK